MSFIGDVSVQLRDEYPRRPPVKHPASTTGDHTHREHRRERRTRGLRIRATGELVVDGEHWCKKMMLSLVVAGDRELAIGEADGG